MNKRTLLIALAVIVLAVAAINAFGGSSSGSSYSPSGSYSDPGTAYPAENGYLEQTEGGYVGSDGTDSYYFDPDSGCTVTSDGVSC
jgi:uncharacterized protein YraI